MKKFFLVVLVAALFLGIGIVPCYSKVVVKLGHIRDTEHPTHLAALKFKELAEKYSNGNLQVKVFPNSQLGGPKEMFSQL